MTQKMHERFLTDIAAERRQLSRRGVLLGGLKIAAAGAVAGSLTRFAVPARAQDATPVTDMAMAPFASDIEVLNYALTLEHLEYAFYRDGIDRFQFGQDTFGQSIATNFAAVRDHEKAHVDTLTSVITDLGGDPVSEATYNFNDAYASMTAFMQTAAALENTGVKAYYGAGQYITNPDLLTAAGSIAAVEARHAAYLNHLLGQLPFPAPFEETLTPDEVLAIAGPFIQS